MVLTVTFIMILAKVLMRCSGLLFSFKLSVVDRACHSARSGPARRRAVWHARMAVVHGGTHGWL